MSVTPERRAANRAYKRAWRRRAQSQPLPPYVEHGSLNAATNYRCPCPTCREVERNHARERMRRKRAAS